MKMADEDEIHYSSGEELEEDYEYDYSDEDGGMDEDNSMNGEGGMSSSRKHRRSSSPALAATASDNPNAAPSMAREDTFSSAHSDFILCESLSLSVGSIAILR